MTFLSDLFALYACTLYKVLKAARLICQNAEAVADCSLKPGVKILWLLVSVQKGQVSVTHFHGTCDQPLSLRSVELSGIFVRLQDCKAVSARVQCVLSSLAST